MSGIRPLEHRDLPDVAALFAATLPPGSPQPPAPVEDHLARIHLDCPWADPEIPSLVADGPDGQIRGFLGSNPRRLRLDGRRLRTACMSGFLVHPDLHGQGLGTRMLERYIAGPQDLTFNDCATDGVSRRVQAVGGELLGTASLRWRRVLLPGAATAASGWLARRPRLLRHAVSALAGPTDALWGAVPPVRDRWTPSAPDVIADDLPPEQLAEHTAAAGYRLHPDYDAAFLGWLFAELTADDRRLVRHLVRAPDGRTLGWYLYVLAPGRVAQVLQIGLTVEKADAVVDHLLWHAAQMGAIAVEGRLEPELMSILRRRRCLIGPAAWCVAHSDDPSVLALLASTRSLFSRLDGEWWMGHVAWRR